MYRNFLKRVFDFFMAFFGLIFLSPIFLVIAICIKCNSKGPVFFRQERVGKNKKLFKIFKFRTMRTDTPKDMPTHLLAGADSYITSVGHVLRKTSLDELPQIFNILMGQMAVVGPRPALYNQDDLVAERDKYGANDLRPGLTGWAQINGRDELPIVEKAKLDGEYVQKMNFIFDIKVFFLTIAKVFKSDGIKEGATEKAESPLQEVPKEADGEEAQNGTDDTAVEVEVEATEEVKDVEEKTDLEKSAEKTEAKDELK